MPAKALDRGVPVRPAEGRDYRFVPCDDENSVLGLDRALVARNRDHLERVRSIKETTSGEPE